MKLKTARRYKSASSSAYDLMNYAMLDVPGQSRRQALKFLDRLGLHRLVQHLDRFLGYPVNP